MTTTGTKACFKRWANKLAKTSTVVDPKMLEHAESFAHLTEVFAGDPAYVKVARWNKAIGMLKQAYGVQP